MQIQSIDNITLYRKNHSQKTNENNYQLLCNKQPSFKWAGEKAFNLLGYWITIPLFGFIHFFDTKQSLKAANKN